MAVAAAADAAVDAHALERARVLRGSLQMQSRCRSGGVGQDNLPKRHDDGACCRWRRSAAHLDEVQHNARLGENERAVAAFAQGEEEAEQDRHLQLHVSGAGAAAAR